MAHQVVLIVQHGALPTDEQNRLAVVQHPHLVGGEQFPARLLVVDAEAAASPTAVAVGVGIQRFLAHELGDVFVGFLLVAAQVEKLVAQPHQGLPLLLEQRLELGHVLRDVGTKDVPAPHGGEPRQEVVRRQGDVGRFIDEEMHWHRQAALVFPVRHIVQRLDELAVNHAHKVVEALIAVRDAAKQGHLLFTQFLQMEVVGVGEPGNLRQVEGGQPDANTNQNGF